MGSEQEPDQKTSADFEPGEKDPDDQVDLSEVRKDDGQEYLDRDKLDFDPDDGLYSGTAVDGTSEIPGPHDEAGDEESVTEQAKAMADDEHSGEPKAEQVAHDDHADQDGKGTEED